jgi:hypothetical protein
MWRRSVSDFFGFAQAHWLDGRFEQVPYLPR